MTLLVIALVDALLLEIYGWAGLTPPVELDQQATSAHI
jgi:hypothetical protein